MWIFTDVYTKNISVKGSVVAVEDTAENEKAKILLCYSNVPMLGDR